MQTPSSRNLARPAGSWCEVRAVGSHCGCHGAFSERLFVSGHWILASHQGEVSLALRLVLLCLSASMARDGWPRKEMAFLFLMYLFCIHLGIWIQDTEFT
jgi:hypothetical protein